MAAAYLFHLASQQGFCDGNKRTAVVATIEFLGRNGYRLTASDWEVYLVTMRIADPGHAERMLKDEVAEWILDRVEPEE